MSKSYRKKIRHGICTGSNTEYYRTRRRIERRHNRNELRSKLSKYNLDEIDDKLEFMKLHKKDSWDEPTDGTCTYYPEALDDRALEIEDKSEYSWTDMLKRIRRQLKKYYPVFPKVR